MAGTHIQNSKSKIHNLKWLFFCVLLAACNNTTSAPPSPLTAPGGASALAFAGKDMLLITGGILTLMLAAIGIITWRRS